MPKIYPEILMSDTAYRNKITETKVIIGRDFIKKIEKTLSLGGKVLIPKFALEREKSYV